MQEATHLRRARSTEGRSSQHLGAGAGRRSVRRRQGRIGDIAYKGVRQPLPSVTTTISRIIVCGGVMVYRRTAAIRASLQPLQPASAPPSAFAVDDSSVIVLAAEASHILRETDCL